MTRRLRDGNDSAFEIAAWDAFVREDARVTAPARLERRVIRALEAKQTRAGGRQTGRPRVVSAAGIAAALLLAAVAGLRGPSPQTDEGTESEAQPPGSGAVTSVVETAMPGAAAPSDVDSPAPARAAREAESAVSDMFVTLWDAPARDSESLQLVRVRLPRSALRALGVALVEPDAHGVVEVDLIVGDDGLPRDIHRIRPVLTEDWQE